MQFEITFKVNAEATKNVDVFENREMADAGVEAVRQSIERDVAFLMGHGDDGVNSSLTVEAHIEEVD